jgi:hypothetical protein
MLLVSRVSYTLEQGMFMYCTCVKSGPKKEERERTESKRPVLVEEKLDALGFTLFSKVPRLPCRAVRVSRTLAGTATKFLKLNSCKTAVVGCT